MGEMIRKPVLQKNIVWYLNAWKKAGMQIFGIQVMIWILDQNTDHHLKTDQNSDTF